MSLSASNQVQRFSLKELLKQTRWSYMVAAILLMAANYMVFKQYPRIWYITLGHEPEGVTWISGDIARIFRLAFNEVSIVLLVRAIFRETAYVQFTAVVMLIELVLLMPLYFLMRDVWQIMNTSMIHHFLFNPFIGVMLILALLHQKYTHRST